MKINYFDPRVIENDPNGQIMTVYANSQEELAIIMSVITNPEREIPQKSIVVEDLPDEISAEDEQADMLAALQLLGVTPEEG